MGRASSPWVRVHQRRGPRTRQEPGGAPICGNAPWRDAPTLSPTSRGHLSGRARACAGWSLGRLPTGCQRCKPLRHWRWSFVISFTMRRCGRLTNAWLSSPIRIDHFAPAARVFAALCNCLIKRGVRRPPRWSDGEWLTQRRAVPPRKSAPRQTRIVAARTIRCHPVLYDA